MKLGLTWGQRLGRDTCPYMRRWVLNAHFFSLRVHHWYSSDDHRAYHDHPWWFLTLVLCGSYTDTSDEGRDRLMPGWFRFRRADHRHTVVVDPGGCWTVMLTGPVSRRWGFWPKGRFMKTNKYFLTYGHHPCSDELLTDTVELSHQGEAETKITRE